MIWTSQKLTLYPKRPYIRGPYKWAPLTVPGDSSELSHISLVSLRRRRVLLVVLIPARVAPFTVARDCRLRLRYSACMRRRRIGSQARRVLQKIIENCKFLFYSECHRCPLPLGHRLNGFLGLSLNDRTIIFLFIILGKTVITTLAY